MTLLSVQKIIQGYKDKRQAIMEQTFNAPPNDLAGFHKAVFQCQGLQLAETELKRLQKEAEDAEARK